MRVYKKGEGDPEYTIVGSIHGDEPAGKKAIENFIESQKEFKKPVKFIIANEKALEAGERFLDADLNRSFPGDAESDKHEERLAARIMEEVEGTKILDIHTTHSYPHPFATFSNLNDETRELLQSAGVKNAVYFPESSGTLNEHFDGVVVEAGHQGTSQAVRNAQGVIRNFLAAEEVIKGDYERTDPVVYRYEDTVEGDWDFKAENFKKVEKGEVYAVKDGEELVAEKDFYPVLMSTNGYDGQLGFRAQREEKLE